MASELRLVLIILGALILGGLFIHGLWTVRKNSNKTQHRYYSEDSEKENPAGEGFDELGIGQVRVVKGVGKQAVESRQRFTSPPRSDAKPQNRPVDIQRRIDPTEQKDLFSEPQEPVLHFSALDEKETFSPSEAEPSYAEPNAELENYDHQVDDAAVGEMSGTEQSETVSEPSEVLILYILLAEHQEIKGQELLAALTVLGFKYGEMDIFHRHQDSAGNGEVLFSLANMFNPGTFDIDNMDKLSTRGLSLFMTLPGPGEPLQNFNVMHNAAKKLAEEFGGQVLDGQRSVLTVQTVRHYVERIREFQRQRLIRR